MATRDTKAPVNEVDTIYIEDFSGGLNTTISGSLLNKNEAQIAENISFEQKGTLRPRKGRRKRYTAPFGSIPVTGMGVYYKSDGTSRLIIATGATLYSDKPNLSTKWTERADWEQENTIRSALLATDVVEGDISVREVTETDFTKVINGSNKNTEGTSTNLQSDKFKLNVAQSPVYYLDTTKAHFDAATRINVSTTEVVESVVLARTV